MIGGHGYEFGRSGQGLPAVNGAAADGTFLVQLADPNLSLARVLGDGEGTSPDYSISGQAAIDLRNKFSSLPFFAVALPLAVL